MSFLRCSQDLVSGNRYGVDCACSAMKRRGGSRTGDQHGYHHNTPLNGRNWVYIAQLTAGVAPPFGNTRGSGTGDFVANGQRPNRTTSFLTAWTTIPTRGLPERLQLRDATSAGRAG